MAIAGIIGKVIGGTQFFFLMMARLMPLLLLKLDHALSHRLNLWKRMDIKAFNWVSKV